MAVNARSRPRPRLTVRDLRGPAAVLGGAALLIILALLGERKLGTFALLVPLGAVLLPVAMSRPLFMFGLTVGLTLFCEGPTFDVPVMHDLYNNLYGGLEPIDILVTLTSFSVAADLLRRGRQPRLPAIPALAVMFMVFAVLDGVAVGQVAGVSLKQGLLSVNPIVELAVMTWVVYNLDLSDARIVQVLKWCLFMAGIKAVMGLAVMSLGLSADVETDTTITYYEPTANWLGMLAVFGLLAAGLGSGAALRSQVAHRVQAGRERIQSRIGRSRSDPTPLSAARIPRRVRRAYDAAPIRPARRPASATLLDTLRSRWGVLVFGLAFACLLLSYRRSFWVGGALGLIILIPLASTPRKRLMIVPIILLLGGAVWTLQALDHQAVAPIVQRATSLQPSQLAANAEDRYRIDERVNVIAEIKQQPLTGIGVEVPWVASVRSLGIEHPQGRLYVDFGILFWWLKMGVLGAAAYVGILVSMGILALRTWRRHANPWFRHFGLASLCSVIALTAIETTACFTGEDPRFSVLIGAQFGLLAVLAGRRTEEPQEVPAETPTDPEIEPRLRRQDEAWARYAHQLTLQRGPDPTTSGRP